MVATSAPNRAAVTTCRGFRTLATIISVSPFVGRLDDVSHTGMDLIEQILTIYTNYDYETEVIVASIRNPLHVVTAALIGADIATVPFKVISQLVKHPLTDIGVEKFLADWEKVPQSE